MWKIPSAVVEKKSEKPVARIGLGGALETTTDKGRRWGRALGWGSLWAMVVAVVMFWTRSVLLATEFDLSNGIEGLQITLSLIWATAVVSSHILVFVCDSLTGGDARPSLWALGVFWGGMILSLPVMGVIEMLF